MPLRFDPLNIIISGVGGQGNILASDLISRAFCEDGYFVSVGETYGATQRGGSVTSHVRLSQTRPYGPLIPRYEAHVIIGFEPLEVYRIIREYGHESVRVIMNDRPFYPLDVLQKKSSYPAPDRLISWIESCAEDLVIVQGTDLAKQAGHPQAQNVVMVGAFAGLDWVPLPKALFLRAIEETFSGRKLAINQKAFELGHAAVTESGGTFARRFSARRT